MNKKGFTLVELLAVIVILAIIMGLALFSMNGAFSTSKEKILEERITEITTAAINYAQSNGLKITWESCMIDGESYDRCKTFKVKELQDLNLIETEEEDGKIYNPVSNTEMTNDVVTVYRKNNRLQAVMSCMASSGQTC